MDIFYDKTISYYLTSTQTLTFGYIQSTPYVAFTGSFLDIVYCQHDKRGMGRKMPPRILNEFIVASFRSETSPMFSCPFREK